MRNSSRNIVIHRLIDKNSKKHTNISQKVIDLENDIKLTKKLRELQAKQISIEQTGKWYKIPKHKTWLFIKNTQNPAEVISNYLEKINNRKSSH